MSIPMVVVTGPDGSGKSTACKGAAMRLEEQFGKGTIGAASIWDSMTATGAFKKEAVVRYLSALGGPARTLFLFHAMRHSVELALAKAPRLLVVDSYFYKYAASELAYGTASSIVRGAAVGFEKPALTLYLDVEVAAALKRKKETSQYESDGGDFLKFQKSMQAHWKQLEAEHGPWIHISSCETAEATLTKVVAAIDRAGVCKQMPSS
ncbi:MAG: hypothetical protein HY074_13005 [Deltaproteobacteria bacterium]|nr:hypothetical protein [Deltaproteobacteria bacterium]